MFPKNPRIGKEQIGKAVKPVFDKMNRDITINIEETKVYGDLGLTRCTYTRYTFHFLK
ncbi:unnamed protein product [marine sediment metagenome]|uniref:Uncharacterized protein n=1 Tax=marine sediment metagenome TaxID=412755 RepID=X1LCX7_9ZZZZ